MYLDGRYIPLEFEEAVKRTAEVLKVISKTDIKVIRLGLQSTDEICSKNEDIVGPVCDNFAEYVFAKLIKEKIENILKEETDVEDIKKIEELEVTIPKRYISLVVGPKKKNIIYFKEKYNIKLKIKGE